MRNISIFITLLLMCTTIAAQTWKTTAEGYWNSPTTWSQGIVPPYSIGDTTLIQHPVILSNHLTLESGAFLQIESTAGICGHKSITVKSNAVLIKYGVLELDSLIIPGGNVSFHPPGEVVLTQHGSVSNGGSFSSNNTTLVVGPWFDCSKPMFDFEGASSIEQFSQNALKIYPIPTTASITINNLKLGTEIRVYNLLGILLFSTSTNTQTLTIPLLNFGSSGVYIVNVGHYSQRVFLID